MVGAFEENLDAVRRGLRLLEDVAQEGARPAGGGHGVVAPGLADRQGPGRQSSVSGALERDGTLDRRQPAQVVERQRGRVRDCAADFQAAVVGRHGEVAPDVVERDRRDLIRECLGRRLRVVRGRVDHLERGAVLFEVVCHCHVSASSPMTAHQ